MTSGEIPIRRSSCTECCVGLVFSSPATSMYGTSVQWMYITLSRPTWFRNWRIASRNGRLSMSPTVPPISVITTSTSDDWATRWMRRLISSVMCGITCTVEPRYSPLRSLADDRVVDRAGRVVRVPRQELVDEPLVVTEVEVGLGAVLGDEHLAVLERAHRARVDVDVGVELLQRDPQAPGLEQAAERRGRDSLPQRRHHAACHEHVLRLLAHVRPTFPGEIHRTREDIIGDRRDGMKHRCQA